MVTSPSRAELSFRDRMGIALGGDMTILEGVEWAADNDVHFLDFKPEERGLDPGRYDEEELETIRDCCEDHDIHFGLHTNSGVNTAETAPYVSVGVDEYYFAYLDLADYLGAEWVIVHPGYHFGSPAARREVSIDRLRRVGEYAHELGIPMVSCNMNPEPPDGEIQYFGSDVEDYLRFTDALPADRFEIAFNAPHANLGPAGIDGFVDALDVDRFGHVRLNDNRGEIEEHLAPGEGTIDFASLIDRLESAGFDGHYTLSFGTLEDMLEGREYLVDVYEG